jgi:hypothetical protein
VPERVCTSTDLTRHAGLARARPGPGTSHLATALAGLLCADQRGGLFRRITGLGPVASVDVPRHLLVDFAHFFFFTTLAVWTGRTSFWSLYLWGVLFGCMSPGLPR